MAVVLAVVAGAALVACEPVSSTPTTVQASLGPSTTPAAGTPVTVDASVWPYAGTPRKAVLERLVDGRWSARAEATATAQGLVSFTVRPTGVGLYVLRVRVPAAGDRAEGASRAMRLFVGTPTDAPCAKWAATGGDDGAAGTEAAPYRSLQKLISSLGPGQHGCLPPGPYALAPGGGVVSSGGPSDGRKVTIRSGPGGRATVQGAIWLKAAVHDVVLRDLDFRPAGWEGAKSILLLVHGDRIEFRGNDISFPRGICFSAGRIRKFEGPLPGDYQPEWADDLVLDRNRIHGCGMDPTLPWGDGDSGAHGVYLAKTRDARVTQNLIVGNRWRGLQTWPDNDGTFVARNLFDGNATQVNLGYDGPSPKWGWTDSAVLVGNVMTNRVSGFWPDDNPAHVFAFPGGGSTWGNRAVGNCIDQQGGAPYAGANIATSGTVRPISVAFVDRDAGDFRLQVGGACVGRGPASIQPG